MESSPEKPRRGRPPKYSPEERSEKYKLLSKDWCKKNYEENSTKLSSHANNYQKRLREAHALLQELWTHREEIAEFKSEEYREKLETFFQENKV